MTRQEANRRLVSDLKLVTRDAEDLLNATAEDAEEAVRNVRDRLATTLESAKATCESLQEKSVQTAKATEQVIRAHPYESFGIGLGIVLVIGVLLSHRSVTS